MRRLLLGLILMWLSLSANADEAKFNLVNFETSVSRAIDNDTAYATLFVEWTDTDPVRLAERVNRTLAAAGKEAKSANVVMSSNYNTYPVYATKGNRQEGWRARGELSLVSRDFAQLSRLIGDLQKPAVAMQLAEIHYGVSDEARKKVEEALLAEGLAAFRARAAQVQLGMLARSWKLVSLQISNGQPRPPVLLRAAAAPMLESAPTVEGGDSQINLTVRGSIQLE